MIELALILSLAAPAPVDSIQCPPYPGDPEWRRYTCYIISHMGEPPDRPEYVRKEVIKELIR